MMDTARDNWTDLVPPFPARSLAYTSFRKLASRLRAAQASSSGRGRIDEAVAGALALGVNPRHLQAFKAASLVLADLARQGWQIGLSRTFVRVRPPPRTADRALEKRRVQEQERVKRDEQLRKPPVDRFVRSMERLRMFEGSPVSVFSLMRDGEELAEKLAAAASLSGEARAMALHSAVDPYIQFVTSEGRCHTTGLKLQDVWRYFRHTWTTPYESVPGRSMMFIIRDRAAPFAPVVGIGAVSSPIVQLGHRDRWLGWDADTFIAEATRRPTTRVARWLVDIVDQALKDIDLSDFLEDGVISRAELRNPTQDAISRLQKVAAKNAARHKAHARASELKTTKQHGDDDFWLRRSRTRLFKWRRAALLAELLAVRAVLNQSLGKKPSVVGLRRLLASAPGVRAVRSIVRKAKADRVGIAMADISVCGAVAPYNPILGGKLVSLLAIGPQVVQAYRDRYAEAQSEIASAIAGRPIVRSSRLVFLGTTSLYGLGSSQYNRVKLPCDRLGGRRGSELRYEELGQSEAFGSSHLSNAALEALADLTAHVREHREVRNVFGEGVSPRLRKARHGLELLGFPANELLQHGRRRIIYGISLAENTREYLLGLASEPRYLVPIRRVDEASSQIAQWWAERWLNNRIELAEVLHQVRSHRLIHPIQHGARVSLPAPAHLDTQNRAADW